MYIWNIDKLNDDLIAGELPEREKFKYLVAFTMVFALAMIPYSSTNIYLKPNFFDTWSGIVSSLISLVGLLFIYKCNGADNGKNILMRFLSISWVIFIRMTVLLMIPTLIVVVAIQGIYLGGIPDETTLLDFVTMSVAQIIYFIWIAKHIKRVARASKTHALVNYR